tara:strand:- start:189 stop:494 length:306 start_codon:yes stop_codon:yes gene_type:complete
MTTGIISGSIDLESIDKTKLAKGKYLNFDIILSDESKYGNNAWVVQGQSKEEREAKEKKVSLGNAGLRWINPDATMVVAQREEVTNTQQQSSRETTADLPF